MAKALCGQETKTWTFYKNIRGLLKAGYIVERYGKDLSFPVLQLSKKGFDFLKPDLGELIENRFAAQSVSHDYIAVAFQISEFLTGFPTDIDFLTEQQIQCMDANLLPEWLPRSREHIPDGFNVIKSSNSFSAIGIEVELNMKPPIRYDKAGYFFDSCPDEVDAVIWICANLNLAQNISKRLFAANLRRYDIHYFSILDEFKTLGWDAEATQRKKDAIKIRDLYQARLTQEQRNTTARPTQEEFQKILFPEKKSPWIQKACMTSEPIPNS